MAKNVGQVDALEEVGEQPHGEEELDDEKEGAVQEGAWGSELRRENRGGVSLLRE